MKTVVVLVCLTILTTEIWTRQVPTIYDVLSLVYKLCAINELHLKEKVKCLEERLSKKVTSAFQRCFTEDLTATSIKKNNQIRHVKRLVTTLCFQSTFVPQWLEKYDKAPLPLTTKCLHDEDSQKLQNSGPQLIQ
ncbi:uncharacterized protein LOC106472822 isoform X2 [Limulus polyphemus]|uniref:Uncharacterized protein LOC106472822 isoform X2 n=1 Tax=Limulus polyphemus TaxID=6850 RepID=A0ABM1TMG1_LIMPO|nr:uncharacterized protein LOC106472822 isoform X2 [Limulus polyphemus]